jgi:hypothetical protein
MATALTNKRLEAMAFGLSQIEKAPYLSFKDIVSARKWVSEQLAKRAAKGAGKHFQGTRLSDGRPFASATVVVGTNQQLVVQLRYQQFEEKGSMRRYGGLASDVEVDPTWMLQCLDGRQSVGWVSGLAKEQTGLTIEGLKSA